jgi:hypothetical protein
VFDLGCLRSADCPLFLVTGEVLKTKDETFETFKNFKYVVEKKLAKNSR